jgi:hypothetical protein
MFVSFMADGAVRSRSSRSFINKLKGPAVRAELVTFLVSSFVILYPVL